MLAVRLGVVDRLGLAVLVQVPRPNSSIWNIAVWPAIQFLLFLIF